MSLRPALVAGQFYPGSPTALLHAVAGYLRAEETPPSRAQALLTMLPHAGYAYCGEVIGATLSQIALPSRLILLGPNHTGRGAPLSVWPDGAWRTPLGDVPVDTEMASALIDTPAAGYVADKAAHMGEHSLEVLLPFLQVLIPDLRVTPVCVACRPQELEAAGAALAQAVRRQTGSATSIGFIVSSDMNHYADQETTLRLDNAALDAFLTLDPVLLFNTVAEQRISMCGVLPATLALFAAQALGADRAVLTRHATSADVSGDAARVVGYAGAYVTRRRQPAAGIPAGA